MATVNPLPLRHPALTSKTMRESLRHRAGQPLYDQIADAIDQLRAMFDGLHALRAASDPTQTAEATALAYRRAYEKTAAKAETLVAQAVERIGAYQNEMERRAIETAGIGADTAAGSEIRAALRAMSQKDRDAALRAAMERRDAAVVAAVAHAPSPLLTGGFSVPVTEMTRAFVEGAAPTLRQDLGDAERAAEHLSLAYGGFKRSADALRDPLAEHRAEQGQARAKEAAEALEAALNGAGV